MTKNAQIVNMVDVKYFDMVVINMQEIIFWYKQENEKCKYESCFSRDFLNLLTFIAFCLFKLPFTPVAS
jgi:hypothetical protein